MIKCVCKGCRRTNKRNNLECEFVEVPKNIVERWNSGEEYVCNGCLNKWSLRHKKMRPKYKDEIVRDGEVCWICGLDVDVDASAIFSELEKYHESGSLFCDGCKEWTHLCCQAFEKDVSEDVISKEVSSEEKWFCCNVPVCFRKKLKSKMKDERKKTMEKLNDESGGLIDNSFHCAGDSHLKIEEDGECLDDCGISTCSIKRRKLCLGNEVVIFNNDNILEEKTQYYEIKSIL